MCRIILSLEEKLEEIDGYFSINFMLFVFVSKNKVIRNVLYFIKHMKIIFVKYFTECLIFFTYCCILPLLTLDIRMASYETKSSAYLR